MTALPRPLPLLAALLLPALAACAPPSGDSPASGLFGPRDAAPPEPEPLPPNVLAALPPGVPPSVVLEDGNGCYLYSIERTDPPSGYPLRDAQGNQVCEGGAVPAPVVVAGLAADVAASAPLPEEPASLPSAADEGPIDISPVLTAPLPPAGPASAPAPGALPATPPAIVPGDITPPAPLAPLN